MQGTRQGTGDSVANKSPTLRSLGVQPKGRPVCREPLEKEEGGAEHPEETLPVMLYLQLTTHRT